MNEQVCRMCDRRDIVAAFVVTNPETGETRYVCTDCVAAMQEALAIGFAESEGAECDHFHEEDSREIASEVEEFFKK